MAIKSNQLDPIAYRTDEQGPVTEQTQNWGFEPEKLKNADVNISSYGDDSSAANYNNPDLWGGENQKYTGANTKNTSVAYNKDATIAGLNPDYAYGQKAQMVNSGDAGYIQRRNDEIASALYNEGKVTEADVRAFLLNQQGFMNSEANERENTIQSVWKRLGQIKEQQDKPQQEEKKPIDESALVEDTSGKIYGKDTAETGDPLKGINTLADANSIYTQMQEKRVQNMNALRSMDPYKAAALAYSGTTPYGEQTMRDVQQFDNEWYQQYKQELQKLYTQGAVDEISHGSAPEEGPRTIIDTEEEQIDNDIKDWEESNTNDEVHEGTGMLNNLLKSNKVATSAKQEMLNIKKDLADLNTQLEELPGNAEKIFKGDTPDYLVQAYISNNSQRIQSKIKNLENRYSSLSDIYKTEVSQAQREAEYQLKLAEHNRALTNDQFDRTYKTQKLMQDSVQWVNGIPYTYDAATRSYVQMDDNTALYMYNSKVQTAIEWGQSLVGVKTGLECEGYTDMQANNTAGVTMIGANGGATTAAEKVAYATNGGYIDENGNIVYGDVNVSDLIPQVGDIGVMINNGENGVSDKWGHTVYVDSVWKDENGNYMLHYTATNLGSEPDKYTVGYDRTVSLSDFMANGGVGFWNPYKQAQYNGRSPEISAYSPMQPIIDAKMKGANMSTLANLGTFQEIYTNLYQADLDGQLSAALENGLVGTFLSNVALQWAQNQGGDGGHLGEENNLSKFFTLSVAEAVAEAENYLAQNASEESEKAYAGFLTMMRAVEIKLRDESGAAINQSERATNFLQYLPKASDSAYVKNNKLQRLEEYIRRLGTDAGINSNEYIPLNLGKNKRSYE